MLYLLAIVPSLLSAAPVTLHFAWPAHLQGSVKHTYGRQDDASTPSIGTKVTYCFTVEDGANGLHKMVPSEVQYVDPTSSKVLGEPSILLFDDHGVFKGIEHLPTEKKTKVHPQMEAIQLAAARATWDELTGRWDGVTLTPGKPSTRTVKLGLGSMMGPELDAAEVTTLEADVACEASALEKTCVRITVETNPTKPSPPRLDVTGRFELKAMRRVTIVLEPATLVPYSIRIERQDLVERGKEDERHLQVEETTFSHSAPGARKP